MHAFGLASLARTSSSLLNKQQGSKIVHAWIQTRKCLTVRQCFCKIYVLDILKHSSFSIIYEKEDGILGGPL